MNKTDKVLRGEIKKGMDIYGYKREEMAVFLRMSTSTFFRRMNSPETFTVKEMRILGEKLHFDVGQYI